MSNESPSPSSDFPNLAQQRIRENIEKYERGEDATTLDLRECGLT